MKNTPDPLPSVKLLPVSGPGTILGQTKSGAIFWQVISALSSTSFRARANTACSSSFIDGVPAWRTPRHYPLSRVNCILIAAFLFAYQSAVCKAVLDSDWNLPLGGWGAYFLAPLNCLRASLLRFGQRFACPNWIKGCAARRSHFCILPCEITVPKL